jgi:hypothetical protein
VWRDLNESQLQRLDAEERCPQRAEIDDRRCHDGAGAGDGNDDVVEIVVIPVAAEPRRVRRVCVRDREEPKEGSDEENATEPLKHAT